METHQNLGGDSGVYAFLIDDNSTTVEFSTGAEQMKTLALNGKGLNSFISKYVKKNYAARLR